MMYLWLSDIYYLLRKRYFISIDFFSFTNSQYFFNFFFELRGFVDSFISVLGLNIITNQYSPMEIISYLYFVFFALFLVIDLYLKDILYQLDNIFYAYVFIEMVYAQDILIYSSYVFFKIVSISIGCTHFLDIERSNNFFSFRIIAIIYNGYIIYRFITISYFICCYSFFF